MSDKADHSVRVPQKVAAFGDFLLERKVVAREDLYRGYQFLIETSPRLGELAQGAGKLTAKQVEDILHRQTDTGSLFGCIAVEAGLLSTAELETLLQSKQAETISLGHALFATGALSAEQMISETVEFARHARGSEGSSRGDRPDSDGIDTEAA